MNHDQIVREVMSAIDRLDSFGTVNMMFKKDRGQLRTIDSTNTTSRKVSGNAQALTIIGTMLKLLNETNETGNLTFTITLVKGDSDRLLTHDFRRVQLPFDNS